MSTRPFGSLLPGGWRFKSLRQGLILTLVVPLAVLLILGAYLDYRLARKTTDDAYDESLADVVYDLEAHVRADRAALTFDLAEEAEAMLRSIAPDERYFSIRDETGRLFVGDAGLPFRKAGKTGKIIFLDIVYSGTKVRAAEYWIDHGDSRIGITVAETTKRRQRSSNRILMAMLLQNATVIAATVLAIFFGTRHGLSPLTEVEREIAARSADDLSEIEVVAPPAELRPLLVRLNQLFGLLREATEVQRRFIADAAHQLRTPLAGLQTQLDLAAGEGLFHAHPARLASIDEATARLGHLLNQLLAYAKAESIGERTHAFEKVALEHLVEKSATEFIDAALAKNLDLGFDIAPVDALGSEWLLQEALANLIDNAIRYTPDNGIVTVRCGAVDGQPFLEVEDSGPGIPEEQLPLVVERFYRMPGTPGNGCGLGLAIVSEIAALHGASLKLSRNSMGGLRVRLVLATDASESRA